MLVFLALSHQMILIELCMEEGKIFGSNSHQKDFSNNPSQICCTVLKWGTIE